jgi:hypothetical protein
MNALTIADALAAKFPTGTLTPPTGYPAIRVSTARLPNALPTSPWVLVTLPNGSVALASQALDHAMEFHVQFHYAKHSGDVARDIAAMLSWLGVLLTATYADMDLGVTGIRKAYPTSYEAVVFTYAVAEFYGWDITWVVDFHESQVMTP